MATNPTRNYNYLLSLTTGVMVIAGNLLGGWWVLLNTFFSLGILAVLENFVSENKDNRVGEDDWFPDGLLFSHVIMQLICLGTFFWSVGHFEYSLLQLILLSLSVGINSGSSAIVISHELVHRKNPTMQFLGKLLLFTAGNVYFFIDHLKVHHKWVGTEKDPATARYGENVYGFFIRSGVQQIQSSLKLEADRLKKVGGTPFGIRNYVVASALLIVLLCLVLYQYLGWIGPVAFLLQSLFANFLLEYTNYIEHYGLERIGNERVTEMHSWQTDRVISRYFLIDLSRHADHHYYASKPYNTLISYENSPVLPGGYVSMIYYALVPVLFFRKIHPMIEKIKSGNFSKV